jgi:ATP-dependent Clp protease protease subunit
MSEHEPIIYLHGPIDEQLALKFIDAVSNLQHGVSIPVPVAIIDINTPGGDLTAMNTILSTMKGSEIKFATYNSSESSSAGAIILSAGEKGMRHVSPFGTTMVHEMLCGTPLEPIEDAQRRIDFLTRQNEAMIDFLAKNCGKTVKYIKKRIKDSGGRDLYLSPTEAVEFGIVDRIGIPRFEQQVQLVLKVIDK